MVVPMIQIDIMLITTEKKTSINLGSKAGLGTTPTITSGEIGQSGVIANLGTATINTLLNAITGFGVLNLGQVTENFYSSLTALENDKKISIESTPKIATLNGQKASLSIGRTTSYQKVNVDVQSSVVQQGVLKSQIWEPITAALTVNIQPFVSSDEQITLTIKVDQDAFDGIIAPGAPPDRLIQKFESIVRVKNGEVILLGGLEESSDNNTGQGVPFLQKIPVIKWLFSSRSKTKSKKKLHILIKATVTY